MTAVLAWSYSSTLTVLEALLVLQVVAPECTWALRDSDALGRYVAGRCDAAKIKVYQDDGELEAWYDPQRPDSASLEERVVQQLLPALGADDVKRAR